MLLSHRIRLNATSVQRAYFARAPGTARRVWNWALAEWARQVASGLRPDAMALTKQFNVIKYAHSDWLDSEGRPWLRTIHRGAHAQPFVHLAHACTRCIAARKAGRPCHPPRFKKKGRNRDSLYIANDKFLVKRWSAILPKIGHWFLAVQVEVPQEEALRRRKVRGRKKMLRIIAYVFESRQP